ncbi:MAG: hypothetical protein PF487_14525, partial [Bacteroidales bacterium]|nr:hypothetical protein [Bacteroidales bacterium]
MKKIYKNSRVSLFSIIIFTVISFFVNINFSYSQNITQLPVVYGSNLSQSFQGTEYNSNFILAFNVIQGRRTFELGLIMDNRDVISGAEFVHKFYLNKKLGHNEYSYTNYSIRPYIIYNLVYHRATSNSQLLNNLIIDGESTIDFRNLEEPEKVTT